MTISMSDGFIDTTLFVHALANDSRSRECRNFLALVEQGVVQVRLEPVVLHELSYAAPRFAKQMSRDDVADYMQGILSWRGIQADKDLLAESIHRWQFTRGLAFVDAYLAALATRDRAMVFTMNIRKLQHQGVEVPSPLPGT